MMMIRLLYEDYDGDNDDDGDDDGDNAAVSEKIHSCIVVSYGLYQNTR